MCEVDQQLGQQRFRCLVLQVDRSTIARQRLCELLLAESERPEREVSIVGYSAVMAPTGCIRGWFEGPSFLSLSLALVGPRFEGTHGTCVSESGG